MSWIMHHLTGRPQYLRLRKTPFQFTLHTSDFIYNAESCHQQKCTCACEVLEEYRGLVDDFVG